MSELIQLRRRIKAVETTKKIAHAMKLIAISTHTRMRPTITTFKNFANETRAIFDRIWYQIPSWHHPIVTPPANEKHLIIVIGAQRGLCGGFTLMLSQTFESLMQEGHKLNKKSEVIAVGKKTIEYIKNSSYPHTIRTYDTINQETVDQIAQEITRHIMYVSIPYSSVSVVANHAKTFFVYRSTKTILVPFEKPTNIVPSSTDHEILWHSSPQQVLDSMVQTRLEASLHLLLIESLFSEQAARFISMDQSTRNANELLSSTRLHYNKLRQAQITKELIELSGGMMSNQ